MDLDAVAARANAQEFSSSTDGNGDESHSDSQTDSEEAGPRRSKKVNQNPWSSTESEEKRNSGIRDDKKWGRHQKRPRGNAQTSAESEDPCKSKSEECKQPGKNVPRSDANFWSSDEGGERVKTSRSNVDEKWGKKRAADDKLEVGVRKHSKRNPWSTISEEEKGDETKQDFVQNGQNGGGWGAASSGMQADNSAPTLGIRGVGKQYSGESVKSEAKGGGRSGTIQGTQERVSHSVHNWQKEVDVGGRDSSSVGKEVTVSPPKARGPGKKGQGREGSLPTSTGVREIGQGGADYLPKDGGVGDFGHGGAGSLSPIRASGVSDVGKGVAGSLPKERGARGVGQDAADSPPKVATRPEVAKFATKSALSASQQTQRNTPGRGFAGKKDQVDGRDSGKKVVGLGLSQEREDGFKQEEVEEEEEEEEDSSFVRT